MSCTPQSDSQCATSMYHCKQKMPKAEADMIRKIYKQNLADYAQLHGQADASPLGITSVQALLPGNSRVRPIQDPSSSAPEAQPALDSPLEQQLSNSGSLRRHSHDAENIFLSALIEAGSTRAYIKDKSISVSTQVQGDEHSAPPTEDFIKLNRILADFPYNAALNAKLSPRAVSPLSSLVHNRDGRNRQDNRARSARPTSAPSLRARRDVYMVNALVEKLHIATNDLMHERRRRMELETRVLQNNEAIFRAAYSQARVMVLVELREALLTALTASTGELPEIISDALRGLSSN